MCAWRRGGGGFPGRNDLCRDGTCTRWNTPPYHGALGPLQRQRATRARILSSPSPENLEPRPCGQAQEQKPIRHLKPHSRPTTGINDSCDSETEMVKIKGKCIFKKTRVPCRGHMLPINLILPFLPIMEPTRRTRCWGVVIRKADYTKLAPTNKIAIATLEAHLIMNENRSDLQHCHNDT